MAEFPAPPEGIVLTHFIASDVDRTRLNHRELAAVETLAGRPARYLIRLWARKLGSVL
jgi:hypothetical protein